MAAGTPFAPRSNGTVPRRGVRPRTKAFRHIREVVQMVVDEMREDGIAVNWHGH